MLGFTEFAGATENATAFDVMLERRRPEQTYGDVVCEHVAERQSQLGIRSNLDPGARNNLKTGQAGFKIAAG